jgi:hypothetical protein
MSFDDFYVYMTLIISAAVVCAFYCVLFFPIFDVSCLCTIYGNTENNNSGNINRASLHLFCRNTLVFYKLDSNCID